MTHELLPEIYEFLGRHPMGKTVFGHLAVKNTKLVQRLENGGDITTRKAREIREFMANYGKESAGAAE